MNRKLDLYLVLFFFIFTFSVPTHFSVLAASYKFAFPFHFFKTRLEIIDSEEISFGSSIKLIYWDHISIKDSIIIKHSLQFTDRYWNENKEVGTKKNTSYFFHAPSLSVIFSLSLFFSLSLSNSFLLAYFCTCFLCCMKRSDILHWKGALKQIVT